ncbi:ATP-dependent Clp protease proteolytic subunit-related protein 3, chloroplastic [Cinnamomum micranthum f. kanehirae]|uniref:ATP-dependent Clp protease proteolytic subunit n=1 Tax=Cinnamomum micranthum f. kanehirae TaxID=337451 RepID=A0A443PTT7_9MAGN|nr:ATP-dependent Clp protease proteolytic subunit-related protein 3, chloroplastic [Cinnamomum micranthum f. kanehirae]
MACVTTGFWCSSNMKMPMLSSKSSPSISCRSIPMPPLNPRDPFLSKLVSVANSENPETPPLLDLFGNPKLMANTDQVESAVMYNEHRPRQHSPDLRSLLLRGRIVYIGMPLVPGVSELVTAQLLYLQWMDPNQPIYLYINSSGMLHHDLVQAVLESETSESFAVYDTMMQLTNEIQTVAVDTAIGQACLLLAAGKKGKRFMFPHARVMIRPPPGTLRGTRASSDIHSGTDEAFKTNDTLVKLLASHTGRSTQTLTSVMRVPLFMTSTKARDFGIIDKILCQRGTDGENGATEIATSENPETPPHLNLFENPKLMANNTDQVESAVGVMHNGDTPRQHSPELQSFLLRRGIVYIGKPLVPAATELVIAQLLYLQWMDPNQPIYLHINSSGMARDDDVMVALEPESFAIYDTMMQLTNEIRTVAVGPVIGQACLLLAAGKKGRRSMFPHARVMIRPPHGTLPGTRPTSDIRIGTDGAFKIRDTLVKLLAKHTGILEQTLTSMMRKPFYMDCTRARDLGIVDKILWRGQEELKKKMEPPDWFRKAGLKLKQKLCTEREEGEEEGEEEMACVTMGFWCSSNVKMPMFPSMSSPRIGCRSIPIPPLNPRDPFLSKLVSVATSKNPETPPHLNLFENPKLMANNTDQVESAVSVMHNEHTPRQHSPDLQSFLLRRRIVYISKPLVLDVLELVTAELLYLQWMDPNQPIYLYINSSGMTSDDGKTVAMESESFTIYDTMMQLTNEIQTVAVGAAIGQACLLLAAGKKGRRFMLPHTRVMIRYPHFSHVEKQTSDVFIRIEEALERRNSLENLLARHTGRPIKEVISVMRKPFFMSSTEARDFGIVDKILCCGQEEQMEKMNPPEDQDSKAGIETVDGIELLGSFWHI